MRMEKVAVFNSRPILTLFSDPIRLVVPKPLVDYLENALYPYIVSALSVHIQYLNGA